MKYFLTAATLVASVSAYGYTVNPNGPFPNHSESGQQGTNNCGTTDSPSAKCQTLRINSAEDFCLFAPPEPGSTVGDTEEVQVSWCTQKGHGSRLMPKGAITGSHWIETPNFIQITGTGDFTKMNIKRGDEGGELDPHGATGEGNPIGALVIVNFDGKLTQATEWNEFISYNEFCIRVCKPGADAARWCNHIYDVMGCYWNDPGNYNTGSFDACKADNPELPMGEYYKNGGISTWHQGVNPTPDGHPAGKSSQCTKVASPGGAAYGGSATTTSSKPTTTGKACSKTSDCTGQPIPANSHQFCHNSVCTFGCNKNFQQSGNTCVSTSSGSSGKSCSKTSDCAGQTIPANSHQFCHDSKCTFGCNKNYAKNSAGTGCVKA